MPPRPFERLPCGGVLLHGRGGERLEVSADLASARLRGASGRAYAGALFLTEEGAEPCRDALRALVTAEAPACDACGMPLKRMAHVESVDRPEPSAATPVASVRRWCAAAGCRGADAHAMFRVGPLRLVVETTDAQ